MLVPFVIDADSLTPDPDWTPGTLRACHNSLLTVWRQFGLLMHDGMSFERSALYRALPQLPVKVRSLWQEQLKVSPPVSCGTDWNGLVNPGTLRDAEWQSEIAFVDDVHAMADFEFSEVEDERSVQLSADMTIDVCRLQCAGSAKPFVDATIRAAGHIHRQETYQQIWDTRFAGLSLAPIKQISLVDRYAVEQHKHCPQIQLSGLCRFLKLLDHASDQERYVKLFSSRTQDLINDSLDTITDNLRTAVRQLEFRHLRRLDMVLVPDTHFGGLAHDRFIRFGQYVWDVGLGLEIFQGPNAGKTSAAAFKAGEVVREYKDIEDALDRDARVASVRLAG